MRAKLLLGCLAIGSITRAQLPITVDWSVFLPYGSEMDAPGLINIDQDTVSLMVLDSSNAWSTSDGIIRQYLSDGTSITGYWPEYTIGCGTLDHYVDFAMRNDSLWGISGWQYISGPITYCTNSPSGGFSQDPMENGEFLEDGVRDLLVGRSSWYICAWHDVSQSQRDGRIVALEMSDNVLWQVDLPMNDFGEAHTLAIRGDTLVVGAFPELHWLDVASGAHLGTTTLYTGPPGTGRVLWDGGSFLWAANAGGTLHYGRLDDLAAPLFANAIAGSSVNAIAKDAQDRLWIGGTNGAGGVLTRIGPSGNVDGTWTHGASVSDLEFAGGKLYWTGRLLPNAPDTYLICGTPNP